MLYYLSLEFFCLLKLIFSLPCFIWMLFKQFVATFILTFSDISLKNYFSWVENYLRINLLPAWQSGLLADWSWIISWILTTIKWVVFTAWIRWGHRSSISVSSAEELCWNELKQRCYCSKSWVTVSWHWRLFDKIRWTTCNLQNRGEMKRKVAKHVDKCFIYNSHNIDSLLFFTNMLFLPRITVTGRGWSKVECIPGKINLEENASCESKLHLFMCLRKYFSSLKWVTK